MKKTTLMMIASASMLLAAPAVTTPTPSAPQKAMLIMAKGQGNGMGMKNSCKCKMNKGMKSMQQKKMKMKMNSPFLIKHGLPHLTKMIMPYMNDPAFNLTAEQKSQLTEVRKTTMSAIMDAKPKVMALRKEIITASRSGVKADVLKDKVAKLALLEAATTMTHLRCIESTKAILTKDQMYFLLTNKNKKMNHGKKMMQGKPMMMRGNAQPKLMIMKMNKAQGQSMKCASGKCGQGK